MLTSIPEHDGAGPQASQRAFGRALPPREDWLARSLDELVIDPALPIVDAHHHMLDAPGHRYLLPEFARDLATGHNIVATVYADCLTMYRADGPVELRPVGEVEFVAGMAAMSASGRYGSTRVAGAIVGFADLTLGDQVVPVLEAEMAAAGGRLRGIRNMASWDEDPVIGNLADKPGLYLRRDFRHGLRRLHELGLSFDALVFHPQIPEVTDLARAFPDLSVILNHMGSPLGYGRFAGRREEVFAIWRESMRELAACPNVSVKLGGVTTRLAAFNYLQDPRPPTSMELAGCWSPYVETCIELFGPRRCMFESNFPVDKAGVGYRTLWNAFKRMTHSASAEEKHLLFSGTAEQVYRLRGTPHGRPAAGELLIQGDIHG